MLHFLSRITIPPERTFFYCTLFFVCLGFLVYGNSLDGEFIGDDMVLIVQNSNVQEGGITALSVWLVIYWIMPYGKTFPSDTI